MNVVSSYFSQAGVWGRGQFSNRGTGGSNINLEAASEQPAEATENDGTKAISQNSLVALAQYTLKQVRRLVILVTGMTVLLIGIIMFVTPGPALIVIPAGLGILAIEFAWARKLLVKAKAQVSKSISSFTEQQEKKPSDK